MPSNKEIISLRTPSLTGPQQKLTPPLLIFSWDSKITTKSVSTHSTLWSSTYSTVICSWESKVASQSIAIKLTSLRHLLKQTTLIDSALLRWRYQSKLVRPHPTWQSLQKASTKVCSPWWLLTWFFLSFLLGVCSKCGVLWMHCRSLCSLCFSDWTFQKMCSIPLAN